MGKFHYQSPINTSGLVGDAAWASYQNTTLSASLDAAMIIEDARANDVCCLGPWNLSNLLNLRYNRDKYFEYEDLTTPEVKPLHAKANISEFNYWEEGKGYVPQPDTIFLKNAFRPFAVIDTSRRVSYYSEKPIQVSLHIVNDTSKGIKANISAEIKKDGQRIAYKESEMYSNRGSNTEIDLVLPPCPALGKCEYIYSANNEDGKLLDLQKREIHIDGNPKTILKSNIAIIGAGHLKPLLSKAKAKFAYITLNSNLDDYSVLVIEKNAVKAGTNFNAVIRTFAEKGGKVFVMEQTVSPFSGLSLEQIPVQAAFISNTEHSAFKNLDDSLLSFWSDDAYSDEGGSSYVAKLLYSKDDCSNIRPLIYAGEGEFGTGNYELTPLFEFRQKKGLIVACQMELTDKAKEIPAAAQLLSNLLVYADSFKIPEYEKVYFTDLAGSESNIEQALAFTQDGGDSVIWHLSPEAAGKISGIVDVDLVLEKKPEGIWNGIKSSNSSITAGIHNSDLCGISRFQYMGEEYINRTIAEYTIKHTDGLIPVAETIPESAMCALYVHEGRTEPMRAYTVTKYCYENTEPHEIIIGYINYGKGRIFISTFSEKEDVPRTKRVKKQLLLNLGAAPESETLLIGDFIPKQEAKDGIPKHAYFLSSKRAKNSDLKKILTLCEYKQESLSSDTPELVFPFSKIDSINSEFLLTRDSVYIYYSLYTPVQRLVAELQQDIPDPLANTYLNIIGSGNAELWINGEWFGKVKKGVRFSEIGLEKGWNNILIFWTPDAMGVPSLKMKWVNINGRAEDTFLFR